VRVSWTLRFCQEFTRLIRCEAKTPGLRQPG